MFMGYHGLPEITRDVFTQDGFLRSGDIGYVSEVCRNEFLGVFSWTT